MKNSVLHFVFALMVLVFGAAAEELLPKFAGVGFPVLLMAVQTTSVRRTAVEMAVFALAAGTMEDALSALPMMTSASCFLAIAALVRWTRLPVGAAALTYPVYQLWLLVWMPALKGNMFHRLLLSLPVGVVTALAVGWLLVRLERKAALGETG